MKKLYTVFLLTFIAVYAHAQIPSGYYNAAKGKSGQALKTALCGIIYSHTQRTYTQLWADYQTTDMRDDGYIYDMYSGITNYEWQSKGVTTSKEGSGYNREHSFPKSWFSEAYPMYTDLHHLVPSDGWVNSCRSNNPFGEVGSTYKSSSGDFSKWGACAVSGYTGTVFEPNDLYKGDFARIYFYMATAYENQITGWSAEILDGTTYPAYKEWQLNMLLKWAINDPVSDKEVKRNNAIYSIQKNRNPYVDYPGLEQIVWGTKTDVAFDPDSYDSASILDGAGGYNGAGIGGIDDGGGGGSTGGEGGGSGGTSSTGNTYVRVTSTADLMDGVEYLIVCPGKNKAAGVSGDKRLTAVDITIEDKTITTSAVKVGYHTAAYTPSASVIETETNGTNQPQLFTLEAVGSNWALHNENEDFYLALTSNANAVHQASSSSSTDAQWTITLSGENMTIKNANRTSYKLQYNASSPMFRCYTSTQQAVTLYRRLPETITSVELITNDEGEQVVYDLQGRRVQNPTQGVYIINGKKVLLK